MSDVPSPAPPFLHGRALLIEDNAIVALNAEDILRTMGFQHIDIASSVAKALRFARTHTYGAAVIDLMVSDGEAMPAALILAANGVPVVITTGYSHLTLPAALADAPCVSKPYDDTTLCAALLEAHGRKSPSL